jgi:hypothetical protein
LLLEHGIDGPVVEASRCNGLDNAKLPPVLTKRALAKLRGIEMAKGLCSRFDPQRPRRRSAIGSDLFKEGIDHRVRTGCAPPASRRAVSRMLLQFDKGGVDVAPR